MSQRQAGLCHNPALQHHPGCAESALERGLQPPCLSGGVSEGRTPLPCGMGALCAWPWQSLEQGLPPWALKWVQSHTAKPAAWVVALPLPPAHPWNSPAELWAFPKCSLFPPTEDGHPIASQLCEQAAEPCAPCTLPHTWSPLPAWPDTSRLGKGMVQSLSPRQAEPEGVESRPVSCAVLQALSTGRKGHPVGRRGRLLAHVFPISPLPRCSPPSPRKPEPAGWEEGLRSEVNGDTRASGRQPSPG